MDPPYHRKIEHMRFRVAASGTHASGSVAGFAHSQIRIPEIFAIKFVPEWVTNDYLSRISRGPAESQENPKNLGNREFSDEFYV